MNKVAQQMVDLAGVKLGEKLPSAKCSYSKFFSIWKRPCKRTGTRNENGTKIETKPSKIKSVLKDISNIFVPMIPAFVGTGIVAGIAAVLANLVTAGTLDAATWQQYIDVMNILKNGMFSYLVIYTGINAAQVFGATPTLGGVIGAVVMLTGMNPEAPLKNLFTGEALAAGQGGILGVIFAVWLLSIVEKNCIK